jgi:CHAD domain-containing protein
LLKQGKQLDITQEQELHQLRIRGKKLRYGLEFLQPVLGNVVQPLIANLKVLQDNLGYVHDAQRTGPILQGVLAKTTSRTLYREAGFLIGWHSRGALEARQKLAKQWWRLRRSGRKWLRYHKDEIL